MAPDDVYRFFYLRGHNSYEHRPASVFKTLAGAYLEALRRQIRVFLLASQHPNDISRSNHGCWCKITYTEVLVVIMTQRNQFNQGIIGTTLDSRAVELSVNKKKVFAKQLNNDV